MNISLENVDKVSALLTVKLEKADYQEAVEKSLKTFRKKANLPGFRPGMVPMSLIKKQYGKAIVVEEVNKILQNKVYEYIRDNKINMLGEPLPNEDKQKTINFELDEDFEFLFDVALAPEFEASITSKDKIDYYTIEVSDDMVEKQVKMYTQRNGKYEQVDTYEENDMLKGLLSELDENGNTKEGGIQVEGAVMMPSYLKNEEQKATFVNAKKNDVLVFNPNKAYEGQDSLISSLLKVDKEKASEIKSDFSFQIEEITRFVDGELNQDIFDQVFGKDVVKTADEFKAKIKEMLALQLVSDSNYKFLIDVRDYMTKKIGKLEFPDALLKRIMILNNKDKGEAFVNENYDKSIEELTWSLIKDKLVAENDIKIEQTDVVEAAKNVTKAQFAQYGMMNPPEELVNKYAEDMLKKEGQADSLVNKAVEVKLAEALKVKATLKNNDISLEEFNKLFEK